MSWTELFVLLIIAGICGAIGQALTGTARGGFIVSIALGFIGALLGTWMARSMHLPDPFPSVAGIHFPILWSIMGSAVFVAILSLLSSGGRYRYRNG